MSYLCSPPALLSTPVFVASTQATMVEACVEGCAHMQRMPACTHVPISCMIVQHEHIQPRKYKGERARTQYLIPDGSPQPSRTQNCMQPSPF